MRLIDTYRKVSYFTINEFLALLYEFYLVLSIFLLFSILYLIFSSVFDCFEYENI